MACLKTEGKLPVDNEEFMICNMCGRTVVSTSFRSVVGIGSRLQVEDFIDSMVFWRVSGETNSKLLSVAEIVGRKGREFVFVMIPDLMLATLFTKKVRNSSHCS